MIQVVRRSSSPGGAPRPSGESGRGAASNRRALEGRLRQLFKAQQIRLNTYAAVLDKQYEAIEQGETEAILWYIELEEQLSRELAAIQKAVIPLEKKCCFGVKAQGNDALHRSKAEVQLRLQRNRDALAQQMACLRSQLQTLKLSPLLRTSVYAREGISSRLDIRL